MTAETKCPATGKVQHPTARAAKDSIEQLVRQGKAERSRWNVYQCKSCGAWHKGHRPGGLSKDIRRAVKVGNAKASRARRRRRR